MSIVEMGSDVDFIGQVERISVNKLREHFKKTPSCLLKPSLLRVSKCLSYLNMPEGVL